MKNLYSKIGDNQIFLRVVLYLIVFFAFFIFNFRGYLFCQDSPIFGHSIDWPIPYHITQIKHFFCRDLYLWGNNLNLGDKRLFSQSLLPINIVLLIPYYFNLSLYTLFIWHFLITTLTAYFSAIYLFSCLSKLIYKRETSSIIVIGGSIIFAFSPYLFVDFMFGSNVQFFSYAFIPLAVGLYFKYLFERTYYNSAIYLFLIMLVLLVLGSSMQHLLLYYIIVFVVSILYFQYRKCIFFYIINALCCMFWLFPAFFLLSDLVKHELSTTGFSDLANGLLISVAPFLKNLLGYEYIFQRNIYLGTMHSKNLELLWKLNVFVSIFFVFGRIVAYRYQDLSQKKIFSLFLILFLISLLFMKGAHPPLGNLVLFLYTKIPFFNLFRSLQHWIPLYSFAFSVLFFLAFADIHFFVQKKWLVLLYIPIMVGIYTMPWYITGDLGTKSYSKALANHISLFQNSPEYNRFYNMIDTTKLDFNVFNIPPTHSLRFLPNKYQDLNEGGDQSFFNLGKGIFSTDVPTRFAYFLRHFERNIYHNIPGRYIKVLPLFNVKYLILRKDVVPQFSPNWKYFSIGSISKWIATKAYCFNLLEKNKSYELHEISDNVFLPHIYASKNQ